MALTPRITNHPFWPMLQQAMQQVENFPVNLRQVNPAAYDRLRDTLIYLRALLDQSSGDIISDGAMNNLHSWTQQIVNELNNAVGNPGNPQFLQNALAAAEAISQNAGQIPVGPFSTNIAAMVNEAQQRLDSMQGLETSARERSRAVTDQIRDELVRAQDAAATSLESLKKNETQAKTLLAALGAEGTSAEYRVTAKEEGKSADRWRYGTIGAALITAIASFLSGHDLSTHSASSVAARVSIVLPLILLTVYAGRQAAEHRSQQRQARTLGLQLASLGAFLADLTDAGRDEVKSAIAQKLFASGGEEKSPSGFPSGKDLLGLATTALSKVPAGH